jgi:FkbM family methyltransferase
MQTAKTAGVTGLWRRLAQAAHTLAQLFGLIRLLGAWQSVRLAYARISGDSLIALRLRGVRSPLYCRSRERDVRVLWQVFGRLDCAVQPHSPPRLIVDAGAHAGYASVYFANQYPTARVIAVEPSAANCAVFRRNTESYGTIELHEAALWSRQTDVWIQNPTASGWAFRVDETPTKNVPAVVGMSVRQLMNLAGADEVDILKLDIEGAEEFLFDDAEEWIDAVRVIVVEVHGDRAYRSVLTAVAGRGFGITRRGEKVILTNQHRAHDSGTLKS